MRRKKIGCLTESCDNLQSVAERPRGRLSGRERNGISLAPRGHGCCVLAQSHAEPAPRNANGFSIKINVFFGGVDQNGQVFGVSIVFLSFAPCGKENADL
jgi:hypothetical protein